jgi:hypothetical protein
LFLGVGFHPVIANEITIFNERFKKYGSNFKLTNFKDILLFLLDLFAKILNKIIQATIFIIMLPFIFLWFMFFIIFPG